MSEDDARAAVLTEHVEISWCCHADRGPCVYDGAKVSKCGARTCAVCAPSPHLNEKPIWPCPPVQLARSAT